VGLWMGRWGVTAGEVVLFELLTDEERRRARDPEEHIAPSEVLREWWGYSGQGGGGFQNIAEIGEHLGVPEHVVRGDPEMTMRTVAEAIHAGRLVALKHKRVARREPGPEERTIILIGYEVPPFTDPVDEAKIVWNPNESERSLKHFQTLVKPALVEFMRDNVDEEWRWDVSMAEVAIFKNEAEFTNALSRRQYDRAIIYSHGYPDGLIARTGHDVRAYALAKALGAGHVKSALLLGCRTRALAESASRLAEGAVRIGGIDVERSDSVDSHHTRFDILRTIIWSYPR
jgi:hypothetical protein